VRGLLVGLMVFLAAGELVLRAAGFSEPVWYEPDAQLGWKLRPGLAAWFTAEGRAFVRVNASGLRDREHALDKPADAYRIAVLGDSYAEARQVEAEQTFWGLLPGRLERCGFAPGRRIEVLNFGVSGYGTAQEYLMLESTAIRYRPDLVLLQFTNGNDVANNSPALESEKDRPFFLLDARGALVADTSFAGRHSFTSRTGPAADLVREATDRVRLLQMARAVKQMALAPEPTGNESGVEQGLEPFVLAPPRDAQWEQAWRVTEALVAEVARSAARIGAAFMLVGVPYAIQVHPSREVRDGLQKELAVPDLFYPDRRLAALAAAGGFDALPLAPQMQRMAERAGVFFHGFGADVGRGHWNADGHRAAADLIAQRLCSQPRTRAVGGPS
jgi:lysophospholipase L1-like esterase